MKGLFKKTLLMILTLMLAFTLFACSEDKNGDAEGDGTPSGESGDGQGDMTPLPGAPSDGDGDSVIPSPGNGGADSDTNGSTPGGEGSGEGSGSGESVEGGVGGEVGGEGDFDGPTDSAQGEEAPKKLFVYSKIPIDSTYPPATTLTGSARIARYTSRAMPRRLQSSDTKLVPFASLWAISLRTKKAKKSPSS